MRLSDNQILIQILITEILNLKFFTLFLIVYDNYYH